MNDTPSSALRKTNPLVEKKTFQSIFLVTVIILMILPFVTTFNEFLTRVVERMTLYRWIENIVVPYESRLIVAVLSLLGIETIPGDTVFSVVKNGVAQSIRISWNCIGWQSFILFLITLFTGLQGPYSKMSKLETVAIGLLGTFLVNIFRITLVVLVLYAWGQFPAILFHDYASTLLIIVWLFVFWWFSYAYVLVPTTPD
ncbi:MAG TPA: exosortase/archaeosortase family protein [Patescibacteria group bacterium]|nr:exosortase/archaeosortase family protein [Patescibacteria group bacterium]